MCGLHNDAKHSLSICLLVGNFQSLESSPSTYRGNIFVRQVLPLGCPFATIGVPQASLLWLQPRKLLRLPQPGVSQVP
jgi:hypothetical protein